MDIDQLIKEHGEDTVMCWLETGMLVSTIMPAIAEQTGNDVALVYDSMDDVWLIDSPSLISYVYPQPWFCLRNARGQAGLE